MKTVWLDPRIRNAVVAISIVITATLAGCVPGSPPQGPMLEAGGFVEVLDGIRLAASEDAFAAPIELDIALADAPFGTYPLPPGVEAVGEPFRLAGDRDVYAFGDTLIVIGVPVPSGTPTDDLALAVLEPADAVDDGDGEHPEWVVLPGTYDADAGVLAVGLGAILQGGRIMLLVRSADHDSVATASAQSVDGSSFVVVEDGFRVRCVGFSGGVCTAADRTSTEATLDEAYVAWVEGLDYPEPRLNRRVEVASWWPLQVRVGPYEYELRNFTRSECEDSHGRGRYIRASKAAYTCHDASQAAPEHRTTRHEFFHALQYGFSEHLSKRNRISNAVAEGTARAAETSLTGLQRSPRPLRRVDARLFTEGQAITADYLAQDFWVYLGFRFGMGLEYLIPILAAGATTAQVDSVLSTHAGYPENLTLSEAYWAWARNQAFEKTLDIGHATFSTSCSLNTSAVTPVEVEYHGDVIPAPVTATLEPLTSMMIEIDFVGSAGGTYSAALDVQSSLVAATRAKLYSAAAGTGACASDPVGNAHRLTVAGSTTRYLMVSNTSTASSADVTVAFGGFAIVSPAPGATFDEGAAIAFRADLTSGTTSTADVVQWSYERLDGVPFTFGSTKPGETLTATPFCDGTWSVTATATGGGTTRHATVVVVVRDLGATSLIPGCEPTVSIVDPMAGATFAAGSAVSLRADASVRGTATYPIRWRTGSTSGPIVATGSNTSAVFAAGSVTLFATFGAASDTVSFVVASGNPPSASISSPADGTTYAWYDHPANPNGITVTFTGSGTSGSGAGLAAAHLRWYTRRQGGATWTDYGTGGTKDILFSYGGAAVFQPHEVRLVATDPATGLTGARTITINVERPPN